MTAADLFKAGRLQDAIEAQTREVKAQPADQSRRLFLFELLCFAGQWERAAKQIAAIQYGEIELDAAVLQYGKLLEAEEKRRLFLSQSLEPAFLAEPPAYIRLHLDAVRRLRENQPAEALALVNEAAGLAANVSGMLNEKPFAILRDGDDIFAPVLEVMAHGVYYWVPLEQIESLAVNPPRFPRDLLWFPARLTLRDGPSGEVFLPVLYPGSSEHADEAVQLGRLTDWTADDQAPVLGVGQHMFLVDEGELSLLEFRELQVLGTSRSDSIEEPAAAE